MKKMPGRVNVSVQLDEAIVDRFRAMHFRKHHETFAAFVRAAVVARILEMERTPCVSWCDALKAKDKKTYDAFYKRPKRRK